MMLFLLQAAKTVKTAAQGEADKLINDIAGPASADKVSDMTHQFTDWAINVGGRVLAAIIIFIIGKFVIKLVNKIVARMLDNRKVDVSVKSFLKSLINVVLLILLIIAVISKLGIETTSFAALLASIGVAVGLAFSGNLQNFAGGLLILLFKPFKVGDWVEAQGVSGTVKEIQIFNTVLLAIDNKMIFVPNGVLSSGVIINYSNQETRRIEWIVGIDYGEDFDKVEGVIREMLATENRILDTPEPFIALKALDSSSVNITIRVWVNSVDYWDVYFDMNKAIYTTFNKKGINFPFPQLTIHQDK